MFTGKAVSMAVLITVIATMVAFCRAEKIEYGSFSSSLVIVVNENERLNAKRVAEEKRKMLISSLQIYAPLLDILAHQHSL